MKIGSIVSFQSFLYILVVIIGAIFIGWFSIVIFSEGKIETPSIKITLPVNGQNIPIGSSHTTAGIVTGITTDSSNSTSVNRCYVSIIVNNIRPYHNATADGLNGVRDYSKWYYTIPTKSSALKEGQNRLTGKLSCIAAVNGNTNSTNVSKITYNLIKWHSVNMTGVSMSPIPIVDMNKQMSINSTSQLQQQQQIKQPTEGNITIKSNSTTLKQTLLHSNNNSASPNIKKENNSSRLTSKHNYDNSAKPLSISIQSSQNIINGRGTSTITAIAYDAITGKKIENAVVKVKITFTSNDTSKEIVGHNGEVTYSAEIKPDSKDNSNISFRTTVQAFAPGYISTSKTSSSSSSTSILTENSSRQESITNNNASSNLTQNILKDVQKKLEQNGIYFSLRK